MVRVAGQGHLLDLRVLGGTDLCDLDGVLRWRDLGCCLKKRGGGAGVTRAGEGRKVDTARV